MEKKKYLMGKSKHFNEDKCCDGICKCSARTSITSFGERETFHRSSDESRTVSLQMAACTALICPLSNTAGHKSREWAVPHQLRAHLIQHTHTHWGHWIHLFKSLDMFIWVI